MRNPKSPRIASSAAKNDLYTRMSVSLSPVFGDLSRLSFAHDSSVTSTDIWRVTTHQLSTYLLTTSCSHLSLLVFSCSCRGRCATRSSCALCSGSTLRTAGATGCSSTTAAASSRCIRRSGRRPRAECTYRFACVVSPNIFIR